MIGQASSTSSDSNCPDCSQPLTNVGEFWICPVHGQINIPKESSALRIFLSYGHDNNAEIVLLIKAELEARGHDVWFDMSEIKSGLDWRRSITDGITGSDRVLSFISRHSTRDPGVCLDEIAIAIGAKRGNIQTVLIESEQEARPPASISHIQWLDMHNWKDRLAVGGSDWDQWFQAKLSEIIAVVESDESRRFAGEIERLEQLLNPISSDSRISELLGKRLIGRSWLLDAVEKWHSSKDNASRLLFITGSPGSGKSAFAAHLAHYGRDKAIAVQFCEYDKPSHCDAKRIVLTLAFQIATRLPDYRKLLLGLSAINRLESKPSSELFDYLITEPLNRLIDGGRERYVIVLDALDEASEHGHNPLVEMLVANASRMPRWIGIVATSRPESNVLNSLQSLSPLTIEIAGESNQQDIREYLWTSLARHLEARSNASHLVETICDKSEGLFLYIERFCEDIRCGHLSLDHVGEFPQGLKGMYFQYMRRQFPDIEAYRKNVRPLLRIILAGCGALPVEIVQRHFDWKDEEVRDAVSDLGTLFVKSNEQVGSWLGLTQVLKPYHKSLGDYLADDLSAGPYFVSVTEGCRLLAEDGLKEFELNKGFSQYFADSIIYHLASGGEWSRLTLLVKDPDFLRAASGPSSREWFPAAARIAPSSKEITALVQVPQLYLQMCRNIQESDNIGLLGGRMPPVAAITSTRHPRGGCWAKKDFFYSVQNIFIWYSRALEIALKFAKEGFLEAEALRSLLADTQDLDVMTQEAWKCDYDELEGGTLMGLVNSSESSRKIISTYLDLPPI